MEWKNHSTECNFVPRFYEFVHFHFKSNGRGAEDALFIPEYLELPLFILFLANLGEVDGNLLDKQRLLPGCIATRVI